MTEQEKKATMLAFFVTCVPLAAVAVIGAFMQEWAVAVIALFFAILCFAFTIEEIRRTVNVPEDPADTLYQAHEYSSRGRDQG